MDFTALTVELLKGLNNLTGSYGLAIIALTIIVRVCLWPLGLSQQRSMRAMQVLQPKMKLIQERYKSDPQMMQRKMMEFYKENKFNPMAGSINKPSIYSRSGKFSFLIYKQTRHHLKGQCRQFL